jgi:hypothetical protein
MSSDAAVCIRGSEGKVEKDEDVSFPGFHLSPHHVGERAKTGEFYNSLGDSDFQRYESYIIVNLNFWSESQLVHLLLICFWCFETWSF